MVDFIVLLQSISQCHVTLTTRALLVPDSRVISLGQPHRYQIILTAVIRCPAVAYVHDLPWSLTRCGRICSEEGYLESSQANGVKRTS